MSPKVKNGLSFDIEEWFHLLDLPSTPPFSQWLDQPRTVEKNTHRILEILDEYSCKATFFVLGWVAENYPGLVKAIAEAGHEIACHSYAHELVYQQGADRFREDVRKARSILGDVTGREVLGYRAPGFSITHETSWAYEILSEEGFQYDSSVFPAQRGHGGAPGAPTHPFTHKLDGNGQLAEFPMSVMEMGRARIAFAGGGYLRLLPYGLIRRGIDRMNKSGYPACIYLHPREIDPGHPRLTMNLPRRFKSYVNLHTTEPKLRSLLRDFQFAPLLEVLDEGGHLDMERVETC